MLNIHFGKIENAYYGPSWFKANYDPAWFTDPFIDEGYGFIFSKAFAETVDGSDNYFVLVSRKPLRNLPYSIHEIYGIRTTGKYHFPEKIYHEFYPIYQMPDELPGVQRLRGYRLYPEA